MLAAALVLVLALRVVAILLLRPGGYLLDALGDFGFYRALAELTLGGRLPYRDFWVEYPPLFPLALIGVYRLSLELPGWPSAFAPFQVLLGLFLLACDAGNVWLFRRIATRVHGSALADRATLLYALQPGLLLVGLGWFDPFAVLFLLLALDAALGGRAWLAGLALGGGALVKVVPLAVGPAVVAALRWPRGPLAAAAAAGLTVAVVLGPIWLVGGEWAAASLRATLNRASWETVWALLEGYWGIGTVSPPQERLVLASADRVLHPSRLPWALIGGLNLLLLAGLCLVPARAAPRRVVAVGALGLLTTLLLSRGYSPQFLVYLLPFPLLLWPGGRGPTYALLLTGLGVLEWPLIINFFPDRHDFIALVIGARTLVWLLLALDLAAELWAPAARAWWPARAAVARGAGVAGAIALAWLAVTAHGLLMARGEHGPVVEQVRAIGGTAYASSRGAFYRLAPALGAGSVVLALPELAASPDARAAELRARARGGDFWLVLDHGEGEPAWRDRLERELAGVGSRATDRFVHHYRLIGFADPDPGRFDGRARPIGTTFGPALRLVAWLPPERPAAPGLPERHMFLWQVLAPPDADYKVFLHYVDPADRIVAQEDRPLDHLGRGARGWTVGETAVTAVDPLAPGRPADGLRLRFGLYDPTTGARLPVGGLDYVELR